MKREKEVVRDLSNDDIALVNANHPKSPLHGEPNLAASLYNFRRQCNE